MAETKHGTGSLTIESLVAGYGGAPVLQGISLHVDDAEMLAVLGRNGAGKTTLLRCISGLIPASSGSIQIGGEDITGWSPRRRVLAGVAHVPEGRRMIAGLTVRENLLVGGYVLSSRVCAQKLEEMVTLFPTIHGWLSKQAHNLSGGQQQLVAIARALMSPARVLLLDEPLTGLSPSMASHVLEVLSNLRSAGRAVLLVEQNAHLALEIADRGCILDGGRVTGREQRELARIEDLERGYLGVGATA